MGNSFLVPLKISFFEISCLCNSSVIYNLRLLRFYYLFSWCFVHRHKVIRYHHVPSHPVPYLPLNNPRHRFIHKDHKPVIRASRKSVVEQLLCAYVWRLWSHRNRKQSLRLVALAAFGNTSGWYFTIQFITGWDIVLLFISNVIAPNRLHSIIWGNRIGNFFVKMACLRQSFWCCSITNISSYTLPHWRGEFRMQCLRSYICLYLWSETYVFKHFVTSQSTCPRK